MSFNRLVLKVDSCESAEEIAGPEVIHRAFLVGRLSRPDFNEIYCERVCIFIVPVDSNDSIVPAIPSLRCPKHFNVLASAALDTNCLLSEGILVQRD